MSGARRASVGAAASERFHRSRVKNAYRAGSRPGIEASWLPACRRKLRASITGDAAFATNILQQHLNEFNIV
jgi:hypothetical protein